MVEFKVGSYGYIAQRDIEVAMDNTTKHPSAAGVYAQQAVETILKQYLKEVKSCTDEALLHTHSLKKLIRAAGITSLVPDMGKIWDLSDAYFNTRYPGEDFWELTPEIALDLCTVAATIVNTVELEIEKFRTDAAN